MRESLLINDAVLFPELLSDEERKGLAALAASDPALAEALRFWERAQTDVRGSIDGLVPDRGLLVCYALDQSGAEDLLEPDEVRALAAAKPALEAALRRHSALQEVVRRIQADAAEFEACWDEQVEEGADARLRPAAPDREAMPPAGSRRRSRWPWRVAVGGVLAAFVAILVTVGGPDRNFEIVRTGAGETRMVELADGSTVRLLESSELAYAKAGERGASARRTRLKGRAYFDVVPSEEVFTVETSTAVTTVLGTTFGLSADREATEVVLATGRVALAPTAAPEQMVTLAPGQMSRVAEGALPSTPQPVNLPEALSWTGLFVFNATPLERALPILEQHYGVTLSVAEDLSAEQVTGTFERTRPVEEVLAPIAATLGARLEGDGQQGYRIAPAE